jgi:hypothetical protein
MFRTTLIPRSLTSNHPKASRQRSLTMAAQRFVRIYRRPLSNFPASLLPTLLASLLPKRLGKTKRLRYTPLVFPFPHTPILHESEFEIDS